VVVCDVSALAGSDLATVDALAGLALVARRLGCRVRLRHASPELRELLALAGLADVVPCAAGSAVEPRR
jgi:anti-anti-sigma regulatory factor